MLLYLSPIMAVVLLDLNFQGNMLNVTKLASFERSIQLIKHHTTMQDIWMIDEKGFF